MEQAGEKIIGDPAITHGLGHRKEVGEPSHIEAMAKHGGFGDTMEVGPTALESKLAADVDELAKIGVFVKCANPSEIIKRFTLGTEGGSDIGYFKVIGVPSIDESKFPGRCQEVGCI